MLKPLPADKWNFTTAAHLLNRAGFGGTPPEIEKLAEMGPDRAVSCLVDYDKIPDPTLSPNWAKPDPERMEKFAALRRTNQELRQAKGDQRKELEEKRREMQREQRQMQQQHLLELRDWWLQRMVKGPRPLQEKMTLFWHGHFATSVQKVRDAYFIWLQNDTFRRLALGRWLQLAPTSRKSVPAAAEGSVTIWTAARALAGLSLGSLSGKSFAANATVTSSSVVRWKLTPLGESLTGWTLNRVQQKFEYRSAIHDAGLKTLLGRSGNLTGNDVLEQIVAQPQAGHFICAKLWTFFAAENPSNELVSALAGTFREGNSYFRPLLRAIFRSEEFYAPEVIRAQVKSPAQWLAGSLRMLERDLPPPLMTTAALRQLGQDLFAPPNVKGWDGGVAWITTNNLLNRYNFAAVLVLGRKAAPAITAAAGRKEQAKRIQERLDRIKNQEAPVDAGKLFPPELRKDPETFIAALEKRFLQSRLRDKQAAAIRDYLEDEGDLDDEVVLNAIRLIMSTPDFQLT